MSFVVYNLKTFRLVGIGRRYETERAAKAALTRYMKASAANDRCHTFYVAPESREDWKIDTYDNYYYAAFPMTTTYSIFDLKKERPIMIRLSEKGGCTDPGTERYHSM